MATTYHELIIDGDDEVLKGFLDGFMTAKNIKSGIIFAGDHDIETHHLKEILTFHPNYSHVIVSARRRRSLLSAINKTPDIKCKVVSDKIIKRAHFKFKFETFNRDVAAQLKKTLGKLPTGVKLKNYKPKETVDPSAEGIEFYSPIHHYSFAGKGQVHGDVEKLIAFHESLKEHVHIETDDIEFEH